MNSPWLQNGFLSKVSFTIVSVSVWLSCCHLHLCKNQLMRSEKTCMLVKLSIYYNDVIMRAMASQITSFTIVYYSSVYTGADKKKQSELRVTDICVGNSPCPVNSPHKGPVTRKMFPFDDVTMLNRSAIWRCCFILLYITKLDTESLSKFQSYYCSC